MKIGLLFCAFQCENELDEVLSGWVDYRNSTSNELIISSVSVQFLEYFKLGYKSDNQATILKLRDLQKQGIIQYISESQVPLEEHQARNLALKPLLNEKCDIVWLLDGSDEYYQKEQIEKIVNYINKDKNEFYVWWSVPFKNYVFSGKEWIDGFCPPRIFRTKINNLELYKAYWDNDFLYKGSTRLEIDYKGLANKKIPLNLINNGIKHMTWLNSEKSRLKVLYHERHFGPPSGFGCSYKWDEEKNCLIFNLDYFKKTMQPLPEIHIDNNL